MPLNLPALRIALSSLFAQPNPLLPTITAGPNGFLGFPAQDVAKHWRDRGIPDSPKGGRVLALILDKDNTFTLPSSNETSKAHEQHLQLLKQNYSCLIVSNTAGAVAGDPESERLAVETEKRFGIPVLRQEKGYMKPLCHKQALQWFKDRGDVDHPSQIVVIGSTLR